MNKQIEKAQTKLQESKLERERKKAKYDSQTVILEGQRQMVQNLEELNQSILTEFMDSDRVVAELTKQLQTLINEEHERTNETNEA